MYTESKIIYEDGNFRWFHELVGDTVCFKGEIIERHVLIALIKELRSCTHVAVYRKENNQVDLALTFSNWAMLDSVQIACALFGEDYRFCAVAFYANGDCINARMSLFTKEDIPF